MCNFVPLVIVPCHDTMYVENQAEAFRTDPTLVQLSQNTEINFAGCLHAKEAERKANFLQCCSNRRLPITIAVNGINLDLLLQNVQLEGPEAVFESELVFNGVCVRWKGSIDKQTLGGHGHFEFDAARAEREARESADTLRPYQQRLQHIRNLIPMNQ